MNIDNCKSELVGILSGHKNQAGKLSKGSFPPLIRKSSLRVKRQRNIFPLFQFGQHSLLNFLGFK